MTAPVESPINIYIGTGSGSTFFFSFSVFTQSQIIVTVTSSLGVVTTLTLGTDYSVSGLNSAGTPASPGSISLINNSQAWLSAGNLAVGYTLTIQSAFPYSQLTSIRNQGDYYPETLEDALDNLEYQIQQLNQLVLTLNGGGKVVFNTSIVAMIGVSSSGVAIVNGNTYLVHTLLGAFTLNLPAPTPGLWFFVKDADQNAWTNNITIHRAGSEKIDGIASDLVLSASNGCWLIGTDGVNWYSLAIGADLILNDISNGHTYRVLSQNGVLATQRVS